jgi:hypothetical protein
VIDARGRVRPVQTRVMEAHPDGSARWLLVDYQADFEPFAETTVRLALGGPAAPAAPQPRITTQEQEGVIQVDTGVLRFDAERRRCLPLGRVWLDGKLVSQGGLDFAVTAEDGRRYAAREDSGARFEIEEAGPLRLQMRWDGTHRDGQGRGHLDYVVRVTVYAGKPFLRVDHVFVNRLDPDVTSVREIAARLPLAVGEKVTYAVGDRMRPGNRPGRLAATTQAPVRLEQFNLGGFRIVTEGGGLVKEGQTAARGEGRSNARGWVDASGPEAGVLLAGKNFWQNYPKVYPRLENLFRQLFPPDQHEGPVNTNFGRAYGLKHYGDFVMRAKGPPYDPDAPDTYYINNECDTPHVLAMLFLRSREIAKWWGAEAGALHMMDVDTCHHAVPLDTLEARDPKILLDSQYRHCYQHVGNIQTPGAQPIEPAFSHTFAEGLFDYYHLTGDRRALEVALGYARGMAYKTNRYDRYKWGVGRDAGWALLVLGSAYRVRPDPEIRRAAETMIDNVVAQQQPDGGILESNVHRLAYEERKIVLFARGLARWHQVTGDAKARKLFVALMDFYLRVGITPEGMPRGSTWPEADQPSTLIQGQANLEALAYAYTLTRERRYIEAGIPLASRALAWMLCALVDPGPIFGERHPGLDAKFPQILRGMFPFLQHAHDLGLLRRVPEIGGWLQP